MFHSFENVNHLCCNQICTNFERQLLTYSLLYVRVHQLLFQQQNFWNIWPSRNYWSHLFNILWGHLYYIHFRIIQLNQVQPCYLLFTAIGWFVRCLMARTVLDDRVSRFILTQVVILAAVRWKIVSVIDDSLMKTSLASITLRWRSFLICL